MPSSPFSFALQPTLCGNLLTLRPLRLEDFDALFEAARDPLIWEQHPEPDRFRREIFLEFFHGAIASRGAFAIIDKATGRIVGSSRYCNLKPAEHEIEIGWTFLKRSYWGGEYNRELKTLMLEHAFSQRGSNGEPSIARVVFVVGAKNLRSQMALRKIGATFLDKVPRPTPQQEDRQDVIFAITR